MREDGALKKSEVSDQRSEVSDQWSRRKGGKENL